MSSFFGMNVRGLAVGERGPGLGGRRPVAWDNGVTWNLPTGVSGATGRAMAVNTRGDVVGSCQPHRFACRPMAASSKSCGCLADHDGAIAQR